ncbi:DMT family transporter [Rhodobacter calidifons]|uniref:DMT family transporter n=1 Tax=Rhodobacter calidifons TaxID=2715277 RepID=A0ABX0G536_9RHOB|nr:DMT family transporter [Rhodobacter calidifons]NHB76206.1 DMT family transporter [Rhodobacter calidifons]
MLALAFGLVAAGLWAVHDLLARKLSQGAPLLAILVVVLAAGTLGLLPVALALGGWDRMTGPALAMAVLSGLSFALAIGGLYKAFSLAPVRVVSPVVGAYPLLTLLIAAAQGRPVSGGHWLAVAAIVLGIAVVALAARDDAPEGYAAAPGVAMGWAGFAAAGFAATFALAQEATRLGAELPAILVGRVVALLAMLGLFLWQRGSLAPQRGQLGVLALMGLLDALALGLVTASGGLPRAEYAAVASSLFGVLTVLLAAWFLREKVRAVQWLGIACVFGGIAALGLLGT